MQVKIINDTPVSMSRVSVLHFKLDVENPDLYIRNYIDNWKESDVGSWVIDNCIGKLEIYQNENYSMFCTEVKVIALLKDSDATYFNLKWK